MRLSNNKKKLSKYIIKLEGMERGTYQISHNDVREMLKLGLIVEDNIENHNILPKELEKIPYNEWTLILSN